MLHDVFLVHNTPDVGHTFLPLLIQLGLETLPSSFYERGVVEGVWEIWAAGGRADHAFLGLLFAE